MENIFAKDIETGVSKSHICPSCGGKLIFDPDTQKLTCSFCGASYSPEKLELLGQLDEVRHIDKEDADENEDDKCEIVCDNCGATLITDNNTVSTFCSFCGSPAIITRRLSKQFRPDYIIPFKITREEAESKFVEFARKKRYVPRDYFKKRNLDKVTGIYVPYWIVSSRCQVSIRGEGLKKKVGYHDKYILMSDFDVKYNNVPFDGSLEIADNLMEAVEPFDVSERKPFNTSYLQGFYAQKFNLTADNLSDRILVRMEEYARETAMLSLHEYESASIGACSVRPHDLEQTYALYPIWFLNYEYNGGSYRIAVNGQTGKTDGFLPVDRFKRRLRLILHRVVDALCVILAVAPIVLLLYGLYKLLMSMVAEGSTMFVLLVIACIATPILLMGIFTKSISLDFAKKGESVTGFLTRPITRLLLKRRDSYNRLYNESNLSVGRRPPAGEYYDSTAKTEIEISELFSNSEV
ncbi:MAG: hypothetical protein IKN14_08600 [Clostridiales bacterium]|nr:hypothetical protein [Clostridiales bacterium]